MLKIYLKSNLKSKLKSNLKAIIGKNPTSWTRKLMQTMPSLPRTGGSSSTYRTCKPLSIEKVINEHLVFLHYELNGKSPGAHHRSYPGVSVYPDTKQK